MSISSALQNVYQTAECGEVDKARALADLLLAGDNGNEEGARRDTAEVLADLAQAFRRAGRLTEAVGQMRRSLALADVVANQAILDFWLTDSELKGAALRCPHCSATLSEKDQAFCPKCLRRVRRCGQCQEPNELTDVYCRFCGQPLPPLPEPTGPTGAWTPLWFQSFAESTSLLMQPPIVIGDLVLIALQATGELRALSLDDGRLIWHVPEFFSPQYPVRLTAVPPFLYALSYRALHRLQLIGNTVDLESVLVDESLVPDGRPAVALHAAGASAVHFLASQKLLVHKLMRRRVIQIPVDRPPDDALQALAIGASGVLAQSAHGTLLRISNDRRPELVELLRVPDCHLAGPPACIGDLVAFETLGPAARRFHIWDSARPPDSLMTVDMPDEECGPEDAHFAHPPLVLRDRLVWIGDQKSQLHIVRLAAGSLEVSTAQVDLSAGPVRVSNIEPALSALAPPYFISWIPNGFFWLNLEDPASGGIELFGSDMLARPLAVAGRMILICQDGVRCYTI